MTSPTRHFLTETRKTCVRLAAYFALLAVIGYGSVTLLSAGLVSALATVDPSLEWMQPKSAPASERFHPSLPPKLRGSIEE